LEQRRLQRGSSEDSSRESSKEDFRESSDEVSGRGWHKEDKEDGGQDGLTDLLSAAK